MKYILSESMQQFVHWCSTFTAADDHIDSLRAAYNALSKNYTLPRTGQLVIEESDIQTQEAMVKIRTYRPVTQVPQSGWPCVLYLHGGGWVLGDLDSHEFIAAPMARDLKAMIVCVDYRLAPEHPFPAAFNDCLAVFQYLVAHAELLNIQQGNIVLAGDSAGGNLAAALSEALKTECVCPKGQILIYPALSAQRHSFSYYLHRNAPLLSAAEMDTYFKMYSPDCHHSENPCLYPLSAKSFQSLPSTFVAVAEYDPVRDDGYEYIQALQQAGVQAELYLGKGLLHGCLRAIRDCPDSALMYQAIIEAISTMHTAHNLKNK